MENFENKFFAGTNNQQKKIELASIKNQYLNKRNN